MSWCREVAVRGRLGELHITGLPRWSTELIEAKLLLEVFSQRYERGSILVTTNLPFDECTEVFGSGRLTGALLDRLIHRIHMLETNGESYRLRQSPTGASLRSADT